MTSYAEILSDAGDEVRALLGPLLPPPASRLAAISVIIAEKRADAVAARRESGIEQIWTECEEAYVGIDDANRSEFQGARWAKPMSSDGPLTKDTKPITPNYKSTAFLRLTARYVDAGSAKLAEILLPADDKAFKIEETPVPEIIKAKDDKSQVVLDGPSAIPLTRPPRPGEPVLPAPSAPAPMAPAPQAPAPQPMASAMSALAAAAPQLGASAPQPSAPGQPPAPPPQVPLTVKDLAEENIELARKMAKRAETRIYDWMCESFYTAEMRKVVFDASRIGVGVLKAPFPKPSRSMAFKRGDGGPGSGKLEISQKITPCCAWVDPWNLFPDPTCGENIHNGDHIFERDYLTERQLRDLKKIPGYIETEIDAIIAEGPDKAYASDDEEGQQAKSERKGRYVVWYFYGAIKREDMSCIYTAAGQKLDADEEAEQIFATVTMVNDRAIRATINPLDSGSFPYYTMPWQRRAGHWVGIGVGEQVRTPQRMLNAAARALLNNAGKSAGSQVVIDQSSIIPADGSWIITPDKIWYVKADATISDVRAAFQIYGIPNVTDEMLKIIALAEKQAEDCSSIPLISQGQSGETQPETLGGLQLQNNNANQLLRSIGYQVDDCITEPAVRAYYEWLLLDPDVPDDEKGDFKINAHGSIAFVERFIEVQTIAQLGALVKDPAYGLDPKKWAKEYLKSKRLDAANFTYTPEEQQRLDSQPPPKAPVVQAAEVRANTELQVAEIKKGTEESRISTSATVDLHDMAQRKELAMLDYANQNRMSLDQVKAQLADTAMRLETQKQLNAQDNALDARKHDAPEPQAAPPPVQLPGRAADGRAFEQSSPRE
jgi:hypothetical protein